MSNYLYDQGWTREYERLLALEDLFDCASTRRLAALGVAEGWRCLEVGCGAGGVARWLAARVGDTGRVVATDLDPRFVDRDTSPNLEVRRHDIVADPLEEGAFDLVHSRAVLEHLPARDQVLARLVAATRPGGWVVIEDFDLGPSMLPIIVQRTCPPEAAPLVERVARAFGTLFAAAGADMSFATRLPVGLIMAGLANVDAELHSPFAWGTTWRHWLRLSGEHLRPHLLGANLLTEEELARFLDLTTQPQVGYPLPMITAWGQRPAGGP